MNNVIIVDGDGAIVAQVAGVLKRLDNFELVSNYAEVKSALGQSSVFSPDIFLIDVEPYENRKAISSFAQNFPDALIIGTLNSWDSDKAFSAVQSGAIGCLLKPFTGDDILKALKIFTRGKRVTKPRMVSFFSAKGRSGKTTVIANLALALARASGELVAIIDADLQFCDMAIFFDVEPTITIVEATRDVNALSPIKLNDYFLKAAEGVYLLCGPKKLEYSELVDVASLTAVVKMAQSLYRYVLIDLPSGFSPFSIGVCEVADTTFMVGMINTGFEVQHMKNSLGNFAVWEQYGKDIGVVFNRVNPCNDEQKRKLESQLGHSLTTIFPNEYLMVSAANSGKMAKGIPPDSLLAEKINELAQNVISHSETYQAG